MLTDAAKPERMEFPPSKVPTGLSEWGWGAGPFKSVSDFAMIVSPPNRHSEAIARR